MAEITDNPEVASTLERFQAKLAEFQRVYESLLAKRDVAESDPKLLEEYNTLMARAGSIRTVIQKATASVDWIRHQATQAQSAFDGLSGVGVLPVIVWGAAVAAMTGAITAMSYWLSGAYEWSKRASIAENVLKAGGSGADVSKALTAGGGSNAYVGVALLMVVGFMVFQNARK